MKKKLYYGSYEGQMKTSAVIKQKNFMIKREIEKRKNINFYLKGNFLECLWQTRVYCIEETSLSKVLETEASLQKLQHPKKII